MVDIIKELRRLKRKCYGCRKCAIGGQYQEECKNTVFSNYNWSSKIIVVGQNPGLNEVYQAEPFVGRSGEFFNQAIKEVLDIGRDRFYITNVVKCFTPNNRPPTGNEVLACSRFLSKEISTIRPKLIITLGNFALHFFYPNESIMDVHGCIHQDTPAYYPVLPLLHPSPMNMNHQDKREMFYKDLEKVGNYL